MEDLTPAELLAVAVDKIQDSSERDSSAQAIKEGYQNWDELLTVLKGVEATQMETASQEMDAVFSQITQDPTVEIKLGRNETRVAVPLTEVTVTSTWVSGRRLPKPQDSRPTHKWEVTPSSPDPRYNRRNRKGGHLTIEFDLQFSNGRLNTAELAVVTETDGTHLYELQARPVDRNRSGRTPRRENRTLIKRNAEVEAEIPDLASIHEQFNLLDGMNGDSAAATRRSLRKIVGLLERFAQHDVMLTFRLTGVAQRAEDGKPLQGEELAVWTENNDRVSRVKKTKLEALTPDLEWQWAMKAYGDFTLKTTGVLRKPQDVTRSFAAKARKNHYLRAM